MPIRIVLSLLYKTLDWEISILLLTMLPYFSSNNFVFLLLLFLYFYVINT